MGLNLSSTSSKVLASAALLAAAAGVAGLGTYGGFTDSTSASAQVNSGTVSLTGGASGTITLAAEKVIPGDSIQRTVTLTNAGTVDLSAVNLTTAATGTDTALTAGANPLRMKIDSCSTQWTTTATNVFNCAGTEGTPVLTDRVALTTDANVGAIAASTPKYLRVTLTLPTAADNSYQGKTSNLSFTFGAVVTAGNK